MGENSFTVLLNEAFPESAPRLFCEPPGPKGLEASKTAAEARRAEAPLGPEGLVAR